MRRRTAHRSASLTLGRRFAQALQHDSLASSLIGPGGGERVHAVEFAWLDRIRSVELYAYRLAAEHFVPFGEPEPNAHVSTRTLRPLGPPERVGDLLALHAAAGIQLRVLPELAGFWAAVAASTLGFSGIRLRNAGIGPDILSES